MNNGWRSRIMAPVYALVISFVLVLILGFVLNDPLRIKFTIPGSPNGPHQQAKKLEGRNVTLETADGGRKTAEELDPSGGFTVPNPHERILVCTNLPEGWSPKDPVVPGRPEGACWQREATGEEVEITLNDPIGILFKIPQPIRSEDGNELRRLTVRLKAANDGRRLAEADLGPSLKFTVPNPHEKFLICADLPAGWFSTGDALRTFGESCWSREATGEDVEITLRRER